MLVIHEQVTSQRRPLVSTARFTRILIVDDNVLNRKIARHMLEQLGYQTSCIFTASNGVEAIACIASKMFDVIILDNQMPIMGGEEAARRIRLRWPAHADRPYIIGATASATEQARQTCLDSGMSLVYHICLLVRKTHTQLLNFSHIYGVWVHSVRLYICGVRY